MTRLIRTLLITPLVSTLTGRLPFLLKLVLFTFNLSFRLDSRSFYLTLNTWRRFSYGIHIWLGGFFKFLWEFPWYPRLYHKVTTHKRQWEACGVSPSHDASRFSSPPIHSTFIYIVNRFARHLVGRWTGECSCYYATVLSLSNMSRTEGLRASSLAVFPQQSLMPLSTLCTRNRMSTQTSWPAAELRWRAGRQKLCLGQQKRLELFSCEVLIHMVGTVEYYFTCSPILVLFINSSSFVQ